MATATNYWNATAFEVMQMQQPNKGRKYFRDDCFVICFVTADAPNDVIPCEPHCGTCGYPPHVCDPYYTRCCGYKQGRWFSEEEDKWIEPKPAKTPEQEEEERWNQHKFGLCLICKKGLDDRADFTFDYSTGSECGIMMCFECYAKRQPKKTCSNCAAQVEDKEVMVCGWDWRTSKTTVFRCSRCN